MEAETKQIKIKRAMKNNLISKNREPNGYTTRSYLSAIHIYINIYHSKNPL